MTAPLNLDAIRARAAAATYCGGDMQELADDALDLLAEVERLAADLSRLDESHKRQAEKIRRVRALADGWASTGEPATKERKAALHGAARRLYAALEGTDS